jgi:hypothetical protein
MPRLDHPAIHDAAVQIRPDQPDDSGIANPINSMCMHDQAVMSVG